jgi:hypothetical protein
MKIADTRQRVADEGFGTEYKASIVVGKTLLLYLRIHDSHSLRDCRHLNVSVNLYDSRIGSNTVFK